MGIIANVGFNKKPQQHKCVSDHIAYFTLWCDRSLLYIGKIIKRRLGVFFYV